MNEVTNNHFNSKTLMEASETIDGKSGDDIPEKFADVYKELFNRIDDTEEINNVLKSLRIDQNSMKEVNKIDSDLIKQAMNKIKTDKTDPIFDYTSDFLKEAPDILYDHLAFIIRSFIIHGHVTKELLLATMVPIIKDKLGDLSSSKNYRSISISSLLLKLIDWIFITLYSKALQLDDFQYGLQENSSTSLCSWMALETISFYNRKGSAVYGCLMDCTKAFDTVQHSLLFKKLMKVGIPDVIIRLLIHI